MGRKKKIIHENQKEIPKESNVSDVLETKSESHKEVQSEVILPKKTARIDDRGKSIKVRLLMSYYRGNKIYPENRDRFMSEIDAISLVKRGSAIYI